ncbi:hypothetical protein [Vibrio variabilis]|uniref:hypothetical protein n=1 Tax=Vibrio variabilis TaxID=990271 RepID=UPI0013A6AD74|nr:hypothetical protein [Vibrio variabilis]
MTKHNDYVPPHSFQYHLDVTEKHLVSGWALDTANPERPVHLAFKNGDKTFCEVFADKPREDLKTASLPSDTCSFEVTPDLPQKDLSSIVADLYINGLKVNQSPLYFHSTTTNFWGI